MTTTPNDNQGPASDEQQFMDSISDEAATPAAPAAAQLGVPDDDMLQIFADVCSNDEDGRTFIDVSRDEAIQIGSRIIARMLAAAPTPPAVQFLDPREILTDNEIRKIADKTGASCEGWDGEQWDLALSRAVEQAILSKYAHPAPQAAQGEREAFADDDMAAVGRALMVAIEANAPDGWHPADCPSEIVGDLRNMLDEARAAQPAQDKSAPSDDDILDEALNHVDAGVNDWTFKGADLVLFVRKMAATIGSKLAPSEQPKVRWMRATGASHWTGQVGLDDTPVPAFLASPYAAQAQSVPDAMKHPSLYSDESPQDQYAAFRKGWEACRAVMLAALAGGQSTPPIEGDARVYTYKNQPTDNVPMLAAGRSVQQGGKEPWR